MVGGAEHLGEALGGCWSLSSTNSSRDDGDRKRVAVLERFEDHLPRTMLERQCSTVPTALRSLERWYQKMCFEFSMQGKISVVRSLERTEKVLLLAGIEPAPSPPSQSQHAAGRLVNTTTRCEIARGHNDIAGNARDLAQPGCSRRATGIVWVGCEV